MSLAGEPGGPPAAAAGDDGAGSGGSAPAAAGGEGGQVAMAGGAGRAAVEAGTGALLEEDDDAATRTALARVFQVGFPPPFLRRNLPPPMQQTLRDRIAAECPPPVPPSHSAATQCSWCSICCS